MQYVHYHKTTGMISVWGSGQSETSHFADHKIALIDAPFIDVRTDKIDVTTEELIKQTAVEIFERNIPTGMEMRALLASELTATDAFMVPDRPLSDAARAAWKTYRQTLRDLSKQPTPAAMVNAWPMRPDGADPIAPLRARLTPER